MAVSSMRTWLVGGGTALALGVSLSGAPVQNPITSAIDRYASGEHDSALGDLKRATGVTVDDLLKSLDRWVVTGDPARQQHRQRLAALFGLEAVWSITRGYQRSYEENYDSWGRTTPSAAD